MATRFFGDSSGSAKGGGAYYALDGDLADLLLTNGDPISYEWLPNPDDVLHEQNVVSFVRYATRELETRLEVYRVMYEALDEWPCSPDIASKWAPFIVYEPDDAGAAIAAVWRAVEPELDPSLPWSRRRIVELYGVMANSPVIANSLVPFPLRPVEPNATLEFVSDSQTLGDDPRWAAVWSRLESLWNPNIADFAAVPRGIVARYKQVLVLEGNPLVLTLNWAQNDDPSWKSALEMPKGYRLVVNRYTIFNTGANAVEIEYRWGSMSSSLKLAANETRTVELACGNEITATHEHDLEIRPTDDYPVPADIEVTIEFFLKDPPSTIEV